jgi:hypothetical protein
MKNILLIALVLLYPVGSALALSPQEIMMKVEQVAEESNSSAIQKMKLTTCKYGKKGRKIVCSEKPRVKVIESVQKDSGPQGKDSKSIAIILEPIGDKGIGMLTYDYDDLDKDADTWLYLSALGKVKRMVSGSDDDDSEGGSFFGTEFSIEDMESTKIDDFTYKLVKKGDYRKRPVWIIESKPTAKKAGKTRYGKTVAWIDRERFITLKVNLYSRYGKPYKQLVLSGIKNIDGVWVATKVSMNNLKTRRITNMKLYSLAFNIDVPDAFLTQRTLTDFAFRERELTKLRKFLKER